jgi:maltose/moltooligosaccharide transporter
MNTKNQTKPILNLSQIINMSVGFFGIQFGWDL